MLLPFIHWSRLSTIQSPQEFSATNCPAFLPNAVVRITIVLLTVVVAILVPNFAIMVTFMGCTVESLTGYILPFALHFKLKYKKLKIYQVFLDSVLLFFGVLVTIFGTTVVIKALIKFYDPQITSPKMHSCTFEHIMP